MKAILRALRAELAAIFGDPQILSVMVVSSPWSGIGLSMYCAWPPDR